MSRQLMIPAADTRLYTVDAPGGAPALLFLGGGFGTVQNWSRVIRRLRRAPIYDGEPDHPLGPDDHPTVVSLQIVPHFGGDIVGEEILQCADDPEAGTKIVGTSCAHLITHALGLCHAAGLAASQVPRPMQMRALLDSRGQTFSRPRVQSATFRRGPRGKGGLMVPREAAADALHCADAGCHANTSW